MATDIVTRLRARREVEPMDGIERVEFEDAAAMEAADEIERLRAAAEMALETLIGCCVPMGGVDDRKTMLEAQAMLRAALTKE